MPNGSKESGARSEEALVFYAPFTISVTPDAMPRTMPGDPNDDHVIAATVAGEADIIDSGDKHLLELVTHQSISVLAPADALAAIAPSGTVQPVHQPNGWRSAISLRHRSIR